MAILVNKANTGKTCSPFMTYASRAVMAEQKGDFGKAAEVWSKAIARTTIPVNREWVETRIEFCANAARRGWGVVGESEGI